MKNAQADPNLRLQILADDLAELQRRTEHQRIRAAIEDAKGRGAKLGPDALMF